MFQQILNWRSALALIAICIVTGTIFYSQYLARKIAADERRKVEQWVEASKSLLDPGITDTRLPFKITRENTDIPITGYPPRPSCFTCKCFVSWLLFLEAAICSIPSDLKSRMCLSRRVPNTRRSINKSFKIFLQNGHCLFLQPFSSFDKLNCEEIIQY